MNVGVICAVVIGQRLNDLAGFLRGRGVVEIDQRLAAHFLFQHGEVGADGVYIKAMGRVIQFLSGVSVHG